MSVREQSWKTSADAAVGDRGKSAVETRWSERPATESLFKRLLRKVFPDQREQERISNPKIIGYLGRVRASKPYEVGDVSLGGFRLVTEERWEPGTEMPVTLQRTNVLPEGDEDCFTVQATAVRWSEEGIGFSMLLSEEQSSALHDNPLHARWASRQDMQLFLDRIQAPASSVPEPNGTQTVHDEGVSLKAAFDAGRPAWTHGAGD